jgi:hypothetical protein
MIEAMGGQEAFDAVDTSLGTIDDHLKSIAGDTLPNLFETWTEGIGDIIAGHEAMGVVIPRVMRRAAAAALVADAQDTFLRAAKALALGLTNPVNLMQAGKLFAIGSAEVAAAAALNGGGGGGGGGSYAGGVGTAGFSQQQGEIGGQGKVTVIWPAGRKSVVDINDPDDQAAVAEMFQKLFGTRQIDIVYGS